MPDLIKPFRLSCMQNMQTIGNRTYLYPTVYFGFSLLDPDSVLTEANYLDVSTSAIPQGGFLDMGFPKRMAEVLIAGEARAPKGTQVQAREVNVTVGPVTKRAIVFGDRYWVKEDDRIRLTEPQPFESMPLTPTRAFGNEKHPLNPAGKGCDPEFVLDQFGYAALPNIEDPRFLIAHPKDRPEPMLFGPLSHEHPLRKSRLGEPSHEWIRTTFPDPPPGFDRAYFNVAPADQRMEHALIGDERVVVTGMSAENPAIATRLPALRIRLFAIHDKQASRVTEIPVSLETVWIFGSADTGGLYYRGVIPVADKQASDIAALLLGAERLTEEPRPVDYYAEVYRLRTDPAEGAMHSLNDMQLMPPLSEAEADAIKARSEAYSEELAQRTERKFAWEIDKMIKDSGMPDMLLPEFEKPVVPRLPFAAPQDIAAGKVDLAGMVRAVRASAKGHQAGLDAARGALYAEQRAKGVPVPPDMGPALKQAVLTQAPNIKELFIQAAKGDGLNEKLPGAAKDLAERAKAANPAPPIDDFAPGTEAYMFSRIDEILDRISGGPGAGDEEELFRIARARALALPEADPFYEMQVRLKQAATDAKREAYPKKGETITPDEALGDPKFADPAPIDAKAIAADLKASGPAAAESVEAVDKLLASLLPKSAVGDLPPMLALAKAGEAMRRPDKPMTSVDEILQAVQAAAGATEETLFADLDEDERAFLTKADHERSQIPEAIYPLEQYTPGVRRRLGDLILDHIDSGDSFARRDIAGADLSEADISGLDFNGTLMESAILRGTALRRSVFVGGALTAADMSGADATGSDFSRASLSRITAPNARFDEARFSERIMIAPNLEGASLRAARFDRIQFQNAMLGSAVFDGTRFTTCLFVNCDFSGTRLRGAHFEKCTFVDCRGAGSDWSEASFDRMVMVRLKAPDSRWTAASFTKSTFVGNCELPRSYFDHARGHMSSFLEADLSECCFLRADIPEFLFLKCRMENVDFRVARARRAVFNESRLTDTDFFASDLMEAQLGACDARRANFRGANLFSANLTDMLVGSADLSQANLGQTVLELPT